MVNPNRQPRGNNRGGGNQNQGGGGSGGNVVPFAAGAAVGAMNPWNLLLRLARDNGREEGDFVQDILGEAGETIFQSITAGRKLDVLDLGTLIPSAVRVPDQYQASLRGAINGFAERIRRDYGTAPSDPEDRKEWYKSIWRGLAGGATGAKSAELCSLDVAYGLVSASEREILVGFTREETNDTEEDKTYKRRLNAEADKVVFPLAALAGALQIEGTDEATRKLRHDRLRQILKLPPPPPQKAAAGFLDTLKKSAGGVAMVKAFEPSQINTNLKAIGTNAKAAMPELNHALKAQQALDAHLESQWSEPWWRLLVFMVLVCGVVGIGYTADILHHAHPGERLATLKVAGLVAGGALAIYLGYLVVRWSRFVWGFWAKDLPWKRIALVAGSLVTLGVIIYAAVTGHWLLFALMLTVAALAYPVYVAIKWRRLLRWLYS